MFRWILIGLSCLLSFSVLATEWPQINGYVKYLPSLRINNSLDELYFDQLLHNRLNVRWDITTGLTFQGALRTRLFQGYNVKNIPFYPDFIAQDDGFVNASRLLFQSGSVMGHTMSDRFFLDYSYKNWNVKVGRQRINWGVNMVSNPNDLFNVYSFFDFDYEERPGTDAIRVQYFSSALSRYEVAYSPGRTPRESVAAFLYSFNWNKYDIQVVSGYFHNRLALGGGWAGSIKGTGFKGEFTLFRDLEPRMNISPANVVFALSLDHQFKNGSVLLAEYLYNQQREGVQTNLLFFTQPLRADNLSFTNHALFASYTWPISPVWSLGMASFYYPAEGGVFISPNLNYSLRQNLDLLVISQLFMGRDNSILAQAGYLVATAVKWSF